ncbi:MAG: hypothetical protein QG637_864 [Chloroflexota bacterium]|nr:hypothetical protein [Chloroflexota bacterium]
MAESIRQYYRVLKQASPAKSSCLRDCTGVVIYGAGNVGKDVCRLLTGRGIPVRCFLDQKAQLGDHWQGVPILQPGQLEIDPAERATLCVIVAIFNAYVEMPPILKQLSTYGFSRVVSFLDFFEEFPTELGDRFWLTSRSFYLSLEPILTEAASIWADRRSRDLFDAVLAFRFTGAYETLPPADLGSQYFPKDIPQWNAPLRFVDCGAYDGDTLLQLAGTDYPVEAIAAFEPDPVNFGKLAQCVRQAGPPPPASLLWPCGVHPHTTQLRFCGGGASSSHLAVEGDQTIQCVALDDALTGFRPSLIKMDVEGAEYDALLGARRLIEQNRPGLAICLYHRPEHLWQIPLLIRRWDLGYKLRLRVHWHNSFELVMYANQEGNR